MSNNSMYDKREAGIRSDSSGPFVNASLVSEQPVPDVVRDSDHPFVLMTFDVCFGHLVSSMSHDDFDGFDVTACPGSRPECVPQCVE